MNARWIPILGFAALLALPLLAQETERKPREQTEEETARAAALGRLTDALLDFKQAEDLVVKAEVKHEAPGAVQGKGGMVIQMGVSTAGSGTPYEGRVEAWRDARGEMVILSDKDLPGFKMFVGLDRTVKQTTVEDRAPDLGQLERELGALLEGERLVRFVRNAELQPGVDALTGQITFKGTLSRKVIPGTGGDEFTSMFTPKVLRVEVELKISKLGRFDRMVAKVVRNNPMAGGMKRIRIMGGGFGQPPKPPAEEKEEKEAEGGSTTYTLRFSGKAPSERARLFKRTAKRLIEEAGGE
jgi:hypothetical protein